MDRISTLEKEIAEIRKTLYEKEKQLYKLKKEWLPLKPMEIQNSNEEYLIGRLQKWAIERYSRQILLPDIGMAGQEKLCNARVLIVGAGGLGCPAAAYLAGAGVGEIGIVDYDTVDVTNIHRQILHGETDQNLNKVDSAVQALKEINSKISITPYNIQLDSGNALDVACKYDVVLDCTDNVPTRYMLNDVCVLRKIPLISGSALKMEGQITVYAYRAASNPNEKDSSFIGPCYRCVFPVPPPPEAVGSCSANGVAGPVPGAIGALQALEAIKFIVGHTNDKLLVSRMILFDGEDTSFRTVKLRPRDPQCAACSEHPTIKQLVNYEAFCRTQAKEKDIDLKILPPTNRITAKELALKRNSRLKDKRRHLLVDVRSEPEFNMCRINGASNYPIDSFRGRKVEELVGEVKKGNEVIFICRRGNDSQLAAQKVLELLEEENKDKVKDLTGGLHAWAKEVDNQFPIY